jgi:hypothetical protein
MSETLKPETPETDDMWGDSHTTLTDCKKKSESLEIDRNRWRSVAEQAEKALRHCDEAFSKFCPDPDSRYGMAWADVEKALSAFDSLRKEGKDGQLQ